MAIYTYLKYIQVSVTADIVAVVLNPVRMVCLSCLPLCKRHYSPE